MIDEELIQKAENYQKKFGFYKTPGTRGYNDETDAFRHAFMQAYLSYKFNETAARFFGTEHEMPYRKPKGMPDFLWNAERNMDLWNNAVGREVANYIKKNLDKIQGLTQQEVEDWMAQKIYERMKNGDLITDPYKDKRDYESSKYNGRIYTDADILNMKGDEFNSHMKFIDEALANKTVWSEQQAKESAITGALIWVDSYTRSDGTKVSGYFRKA